MYGLALWTLFSGIIVESNMLGVAARPNAEADMWGQKLAEKVGCKAADLSCLRAVPAATLVSALSVQVIIALSIRRFDRSGLKTVAIVQSGVTVIEETPLDTLAV